MAMTATDETLTIDAFLGGRVEAVQPRAGHHRAGLDAVLMAAAFGDTIAGRAIDLGAGAGVAGFCLAARAASVQVTLAEREADLVAAAGLALARPANAAFADRVIVQRADLLSEASRRAAGLASSGFERALMNPPFHDAGAVRASPRAPRAAAHVLGEGGLDDWFRAAAALLAPGGSLVAILPAARLDDLVGAMHGRFGALNVLPVYPRAGESASRVIARGIKGSRAPLAIAPGLVLHEAEGNGFTPALRAILREGAALCDVHSWAA